MRLTSRQKIGKNNSKNSLRNSKSKKRIIEMERLDIKSNCLKIFLIKLMKIFWPLVKPTPPVFCKKHTPL